MNIQDEEQKKYAEVIHKLAVRFDNMISVCEDAELREALVAIKRDLYYQPPELLVSDFAARVSNTLEKHIGGSPASGWQTTLINHYTK